MSVAARMVRIDLPDDARYLADGTRVAITGTIVHESKNLAKVTDKYADIVAYLEIETPQAVSFSDDRAGDDWWVIDAMVLVPAPLWDKVRESFRLIEEAIIDDPEWELRQELER